MNGIADFELIGDIIFLDEEKGTVGVSVGQNYRKDGEWVNRNAVFFVSFFGKTAENLDRFGKFDTVFVKGRMATPEDREDKRTFFNGYSILLLSKHEGNEPKPAKKPKNKKRVVDATEVGEDDFDGLWE